MKRPILFCVLLLVGAIGCAEPKVSLATGPREYVWTDYPAVLKRWTRTESLISPSELDDLLTVTATYESWDFRWAYVVKYARDYGLTVGQRRDLLDRTLADTRNTHQFYVALYGNNRRWTDLTKPNSAWIVRLIDDQGDESAPVTIDLIAKPGALERAYFPYTTVFRHAFRIRFPRFLPDGRPTIAPDAKWLGLRFAGSGSERDEVLRWDLEPGSADKVAEPQQGG